MNENLRVLIAFPIGLIAGAAVPLLLFSTLALKQYWLELHERANGQVGSIDHFLLKSVISQPIVGLASVIKVISDVGYFEMIFFATALYLVSSFLNYYVRPILHYWQNWQLTLLDIASSLLSLAIGLGVFTFISGS